MLCSRVVQDTAISTGCINLNLNIQLGFLQLPNLRSFSLRPISEYQDIQLGSLLLPESSIFAATAKDQSQTGDRIFRLLWLLNLFQYNLRLKNILP